MPNGANAAELLQVPANDPDNAPASTGLNEITAAVMAETQDLVNAGALAEAQQRVALAEAQGLNPTPIANMRERIDSEITRRRQISIGLEQANVLFEQGFITAPAENNAVRKLQEVLELDAANRQALSQIAECAKRLALVAQQAKEAGMDTEAQDYLSQALGLRSDVEEWQRWMDQWQKNLNRDTRLQLQRANSIFSYSISPTRLTDSPRYYAWFTFLIAESSSSITVR